MSRQGPQAPVRPSRARRRLRTVGWVVASALVLGAGGYVAADAYDVVPGWVTVAPVPDPPAPFPTAPGAVPAGPLTVTLGHLPTTAPLPAADEVAALATALAADPRMGTSVGIHVVDQLTGEVLADVSGAAPRIPASTAKVLTAVAAVDALGSDRTLATRVVQAGPGRIVLVGGGDVMLAAGTGDPDAINGRAGLATLAAATARNLVLAGTTEVQVSFDDTLFSGPTASPGWAPTDLTGGFVAPVTALAVNIAKTREEPYPPRVADPSRSAADTFAAALAAEGVTVTGSVSRATAPADALLLGTVESATIGEIVRYTLHTSDNTVAEVLGRLVAIEAGLPGSFEGATRAVVSRIGGLGLDTSQTVLGDCSGLADGSLVPASVLTGLIRLTAGDREPDLRPVAVDLPVSGWQGTMADRLGGLPAHGLVRAKTGSLRGVTSLAGTVLTQDGRQLVFAVLADATPPGGQAAPRNAIDAFVQDLAGCGCQVP
ncbi:D-alanyl-D-alanine carboxypeptidase/D-alanyl-D-alanine-endopeptidase [Actinotalea sp. K2]|uniref:D-alanyl-D-alanine carboxypeptidase/D-alanyl-D-alanine endopeptidase n=1 Tax=Actinotalea sp. K2 TaxID=2939438 RepID=UPI002017A0BC|nr:D-alanyl-D-alanine carboxypeptidase/D-alanyl-D-alanine-endopeptidase [Actinotalea sp. K2]MCL3861446.1 D-alanyl-D-alanine carboxypeptidase/D-alanyl-D-alanine-endopeptidase [Actinotalea sp. K2]